MDWIDSSPLSWLLVSSVEGECEGGGRVGVSVRKWG